MPDKDRNQRLNRQRTAFWLLDWTV